jgi:hypothetical protein
MVAPKDGTLEYLKTRPIDASPVKNKEEIRTIKPLVAQIQLLHRMNSNSALRRYWALGHAGPKTYLDSWSQGGNVYPKWRRRGGIHLTTIAVGFIDRKLQHWKNAEAL